MKSLKTLFIIAVMALFTATATAQKNLDKMAERRTKAMVVQLELDKQQEQKLLTLNKSTMKSRKNLKGKGKTARTNAKKAYKAELKKILTTAQYNAWKAKRKEQ